MAWQLIYTSAPRSLEAGRSGFGTVARHREISALLVAAAERASQFSRLPGLDSGRVIYSHRIVTVAGGRFHLLSCIRDAGADYTGRTNHLAHHLLVEAREVAALGVGGPSPADVLLGMDWAKTWDGAPRYFDAADAVDLAKFAPQSRADGAAWRALTGDAGHAALLATGEASRGAYVVAPPGADLRRLFAESLRLAPDRLWQIAFTTALQPSDEVSDFRWIGLDANSPSLAQATTSGRPVLDLTAPARLPAAPASSSRPVADLPPPSRSTPEREPARRTPAKSANTTDDPFGEIQPARKLPWKWIGMAAATVLVAGGAALVLPRLARQAERAEQEAIVQSVRTAFFDTPEIAQEFAGAIRAVPAAQRPAARALAEFVAGLGGALRAPDFEALRRAPAGERLRQLSETLGINQPPQIARIAGQLDQAARLDGELREFQPRAGGDREYDALRQRGAEIVAIGRGLPQTAKFQTVKERLEATAAAQQAEALRALLAAPEVAASRDWFRNQTQALRVSEAEAGTRSVVAEIERLLGDWTFVQDRAAVDVAARLAGAPPWPPWLRALAEKKAASVAASAPVVEVKAALETRPVAAPSSVAAPLYFVRDLAALKESLFPELTAAKSWHLRAPLASEPARLQDPTPQGKIRRTFNDRDALFERSADGQRLLPDKASATLQPPFVVLARDAADRDLAQLWIGAETRAPLFGKTRAGVARRGDTLSLDPAALALPGVPKNALKLRLPDSCALAAGENEALAVTAWKADLGELRVEIGRQRERIAKRMEAKEPAPMDDEAAVDRQFSDAKEAVREACNREIERWADSERAKLEREKDRVAKLTGGVREAQRKLREDAAIVEDKTARKHQSSEKDLRSGNRTLLQQLGGCILAVSRDPEPNFTGSLALREAGDRLQTADARAETVALAEAKRKVQDARRQLVSEGDKRRLDTAFAKLETMIALLETQTGEARAGRLRQADAGAKGLEQQQAELDRLAAHPVLAKRLPVGTYRLVAAVDGAEWPLVEIEIAD